MAAQLLLLRAISSQLCRKSGRSKSIQTQRSEEIRNKSFFREEEEEEVAALCL
jgi:hypothetical protein